MKTVVHAILQTDYYTMKLTLVEKEKSFVVFFPVKVFKHFLGVFMIFWKCFLMGRLFTAGHITWSLPSIISSVQTIREEQIWHAISQVCFLYIFPWIMKSVCIGYSRGADMLLTCWCNSLDTNMLITEHRFLHKDIYMKKTSREVLCM